LMSQGGPGQPPVCYDVLPVDGQVGLSCGGSSETGQRAENEDRTIAVDLPEGLGHMVGIFDGHRGTNCADFLSQNLSKAVVAKTQDGFQEWLVAGRAILSLSDQEEVDVIRSGIIAAFEACDRDLCSTAESCNWGDGASAQIALLSHGYEAFEQGRSTVPSAPGGQAKCFAASCGTGRMLLLRGRQAVCITKEHTVANEEERRRLESIGALVLQDVRGIWAMGRPDRMDLAQHRQQGYTVDVGPKPFLTASRGFGDVMIKKLPYRSLLGGVSQVPVLTATPDVSVIDLLPADWAIVMGGQGIYTVLSDQDVADVVLEIIATQGKGVVDAAKAITAMAAQRGAKDNLTCIVMRLGWANTPPVKTLAQMLASNRAP